MPLFEPPPIAKLHTPVRLLGVSPDDTKCAELEAITTATNCTFRRSRNIVEALSEVINHQIEVIVTDRHLPDGDWRNLVRCLRACRNAPAVIVFSPTADDRFWTEVLHHGGYDLLATPFDAHEVTRAVHTAWLSWQKRAQGLRSAWFPVEEPEPARIRRYVAGAGRR